EWLMHFMIAMCDPRRTEGVREVYEIRLPPGTFHVHADDGELRFHDGEAEAPDLVIEADLETFVGLANEDADPAAAVAAGHLRATGDPAAGLRALHILRPATSAAPIRS
ncbi:MAG TPA: SCP2 sterol-binding domain-containing protein, partial [Actinomycetota bacterium]|nr:SCP2 sterol-binding domain-containing protein [Actinomycetota bacterium]